MKTIEKINIINNQERLMDGQHDSSKFKPDSGPTDKLFEDVISSSFNLDQVHYFDEEDLDMEGWSYSYLFFGCNPMLKPTQSVAPDELNSDEIKKKLVVAFNHLATVHNVDSINLANKIIREIASG